MSETVLVNSLVTFAEIRHGSPYVLCWLWTHNYTCHVEPSISLSLEYSNTMSYQRGTVIVEA